MVCDKAKHTVYKDNFPTLCLSTLLREILNSKWSEVKSLSRVRLFATPWTVAYQAPPSMGFSRQEYWSGLPFPSPGDLPDPGIKPKPSAFQAEALTSEPPGKPLSFLKDNVKLKWCFFKNSVSFIFGCAGSWFLSGLFL